MTELKPCPFCGASYDKDEDDFVYAADHENWCPLRGIAYGGYGLTVGDTEEEIDAWNTRAERTCEGHRCEETDEWVCHKCGGSLAGCMFNPVRDGFVCVPNFCPNCGAEVVE